MKAAKIILILSLLALLTLLIIYAMSLREEEPEIISKRELYQQELREKEGGAD